MIEARDMHAAPELAKEIYRCPLVGTTVIEASAGTGKTYSIQTLYLRLIIEMGLSVDRILVVTFTEAATEELRDRIRQILAKTLAYLDGVDLLEDADHDRIANVCNIPLQKHDDDTENNDAALRRTRVTDAVRDFDQATIFTIHGFCARTLSEQAFESAALFDLSLEGSGNELLQDSVNDWYRRRTYPLPMLHRDVLNWGKWTLDAAARLASELTRKPDAVLRPGRDDEFTDDTLTQSVHDFLRYTAEHRQDIFAGFADALRQGFFKSAFTKSFEVHWNILSAAAAEGSVSITGFPAAVEALTQTNVVEALKKTKASKWSPNPGARYFCELCENTLNQFQQWLLSIKISFAHTIRETYSARKAELQIQTFDDLLLGLRDALQNPATAPMLLSRVRDTYDVALIDEFQDTDPVQYEIFRRFFIEGKRPVFLVGDPKQAIYGFRNGDIFTYFDARSQSDRPFTLKRNYRSEKALVDAVNTLFGDPHKPRSFVTPEIQYLDLDAQDKDQTGALLINGKRDPHPFKIWFAESEDGKPMKKTDRELEDLVFGSVVTEVASLLSNPAITIAGNPVTPDDIAVLAMTHRQASRLQRDFAKKGIPVVLQATGCVFDTQEATEFSLLLRAILQPNDTRSVRAALASSLFGWEPGDIALTESKSPPQDVEMCYENICSALRNARQLWHRGPFVTAVNGLFDDMSLREHLLSLKQGERRLTNVLQIVELIHGIAQERKLGPGGIMAWFARQLDPDARDVGDEAEMRLPSDRKAVRVMTVFKSKGLQFPIVFVPWMWQRQAGVSSLSPFVAYHAIDGRERSLIVDIGDKTDASRSPAPAEIAADEQLAEQVRLLYVALTRAVHRTYLFWGDISSTEKTGISYLLHGALRQQDPGTDAPPLGEIAASLRQLDATEKRRDLRSLCMGDTAEKNSRGIMEVPFPDPESAPLYSALDEEELAAARVPLTRNHWPENRNLDTEWGVSSFSSLAPGHPTSPPIGEGYDFDSEGREPELAGSTPPEGIFAFPAGAQTGNCWHAIFESLDFRGGPAEIRQTVQEKLAQYRLDTAAIPDETRPVVDVVSEMIIKTLNAPLLDKGPRLVDISPDDRLNELEFLFPLPADGLYGRKIIDVLRHHGHVWAPVPGLVDEMASWDPAVARGFMTGFVDLIFRTPDTGSSRARYYIVDYKSNRLGGHPEDFSPNALATEMVKNAYVLQYLIYTVAVDRFLRRSIPDYDYDRNLGGVFYLFLRGMDASGTRGIFRDRPPKCLIEDLAQVLGGGGAG